MSRSNTWEKLEGSETRRPPSGVRRAVVDLHTQTPTAGSQCEKPRWALQTPWVAEGSCGSTTTTERLTVQGVTKKRKLKVLLVTFKSLSWVVLFKAGLHDPCFSPDGFNTEDPFSLLLAATLYY